MAAMGEVIVGPMLRHVGETDATIWVETDGPCGVEILGHSSPTFQVEGHHYAIVVIRGLAPSKTHPYDVKLDGKVAWPPADYELPQPRVRPIPRDGTLKLLFGSCRMSAPHGPPYTFQRWWNSHGRGVDALRGFALRMLRQPSALWPDALAMLGDQIYADQPPENVRDEVAGREVHADGPVDALEDFEEYTVGYREAWTQPVVRWMLANLPTSMIFDDHEINDKWKTSQGWLDEMRQTDWYAGRVIDGLMAYWIYQHLGNLSPEELDADDTYGRLHDVDDAAEMLRELASGADEQTGQSRFSFCRDLGPARLIVLDSRAGRQLEPGNRRIMSDEEWQWAKDRVDGEHRHVIVASSLPIFLPPGMHGIEAWTEAVGDGAWGSRLAPIGEKVRIAANLDHWACFQQSFRDFEDLIVDVASGKCGDEAPKTMVMLGGDVHHCWVSRIELPDDLPPSDTRIWQAVCSGFRKELQASERMVLGFGHTRLATWMGRALEKTVKLEPSRLKWWATTRPHFRNQIGTLEIADDEVGVRLERVTGALRKPRLQTVVEERLR